ncbi:MULTISPECIES: DUF4235 domain-containing protein [unclassified Nesterenkonia]|uniref:DUF4235 domain-containing protein n=1 Tax=unclassified Nesterenkonia TaxID=2629769 RepID=UPI003145068D
MRLSGLSPRPQPSSQPSGLVGEVLLAAAVHGAFFAFVDALVDRGGPRAFQRLTGEWPGD